MPAPLLDTGVYRIRNKTTGKVYIGSSAKSLRGRTGKHLKYLYAGEHWNEHLQAVWNKYGADDFEVDFVVRCRPKDCIENEQKWIDEYNAADRRYGYNKNPRAESCLGRVVPPDEYLARLAITRSPEFRAKQRKNQTGKKHTRATIQGMQASRENGTKPSLNAPGGREYHRPPHSAETRAKISRVQIGRKQSAELIEKRIAPLRGRKVSDEHAAKIRANKAKLKGDPAFKAKMSERMTRWHAERRAAKAAEEQVQTDDLLLG